MAFLNIIRTINEKWYVQIISSGVYLGLLYWMAKGRYALDARNPYFWLATVAMVVMWGRAWYVLVCFAFVLFAFPRVLIHYGGMENAEIMRTSAITGLMAAVAVVGALAVMLRNGAFRAVFEE